MDISKKIIGATIIIAAFIFLVSIAVIYVQTHIIQFGFCPYEPVLVPAFASLGVFIGSLVYYLISIKLEESKEKRFEITHILLDILQPDEREIIKRLIENKGEILQSKLSSELGKVKVFRTIENLRKRGIIEKEPYGKTNKISFANKFRDVLLS
jgi:uncharacterized membrane protein